MQAVEGFHDMVHVYKGQEEIDDTSTDNLNKWKKILLFLVHMTVSCSIYSVMPYYKWAL